MRSFVSAKQVVSKRVIFMQALLQRPPLQVLLWAVLISFATTSCKMDSADQSNLQHQQVLLVLSDDWEQTTGTLTRLELEGRTWKTLDETRVNLGRSGLAWGTGWADSTYQLVSAGEPLKVEGDGKAPAGCFELSYAFGNKGVANENPGNRSSGNRSPDDGSSASAKNNFPWVQLSDLSICVDDASSSLYNQLLQDASNSKGSWGSAEEMLRPDSLYALGVFVNHNYSASESGKGSCIFLHIERGVDKPTAGCTSMSRPYLATTIDWLDQDKRPLLLQYPRAVYAKLKAEKKETSLINDLPL